MKRISAALVVCLASAAAWAGPVDEAKEVNVAFVEAASIPDATESVRQVAALFVEDLRHIGVFGKVRGREQLIKTITPAFQAPNRNNVMISNDGVQLDANTVLTVSKFVNTFTGPSGDTVTLPLRCVRLIKKQSDGRYLIVSEHTSFGPPSPSR